MGSWLGQSTSILAEAEGSGHHSLTWPVWAAYVVIVVGVIFAILTMAKSGLNDRVFTNKWTQRTEQLYLFLENMAVGIIGPHGRKYIPILVTFWLVIFISNVVGLFMSETLTAMLPFNFGMALCAIGYVQYEGIRANGFFGHISHFAGPKMGAALIPINLMLFAIELVSELMKNVSLSLRLYGNIHGGHQAVVAMNDLGMHVFGQTGIPFGAFLLPVKVLTCLVQALIFTLLTCVYLSLVTHHDHDDHGDEHGEGEIVAHAH